MAQTERGIVYPDDYSRVADVPADMEAMAESIDAIIETMEENIDRELEDKVEKEEGKGLSQNDFNNTYKGKVEANTTARHTHSNKSILDLMTAYFTAEEKEKLDDLENYDDTELSGRMSTAEGKIEDIEAEQITQNTAINNNKNNIEALQVENQRLKETLVTTTGTGENITLNKTAELDFVIPPLPRGNTIQDGTPTLSTPVDVNVVSGSKIIKTNNKNFFDKNSVVQGDWNNPGLSTALVSYIGKISTGDQYTVSNYNGRRFAFIISSMPTPSNQASALQSSGNQTATHSTFTATASGYLMFKITKTDGSNITPNEINTSDFLIEKNSNATSYIEHQGKKLPLDLGTIELCKIGNYQDYFYRDDSNGKWYLHKEIGKFESDNIEGWTLDPNNNNRYYSETISNIVCPSNNDTIGTGVCNVGLVTANQTKIDSANPGVAIHSVSKIYISKVVYDNITTTNILLYYVYITPIDTEITDTTLKAQLEAIYNAISYYEQTNISEISSGISPLFDVEAYQNTKLLLENALDRLELLES